MQPPWSFPRRLRMQNRFNSIPDTDRASATRVVSKQHEMKPHRLNLNRLIVQMSNAIEQVLGPGIDFQISCDQDLPPVLAVNNMVKLGVMDLCAAARAAMHSEGRAAITASVKAVEEKRAGRYLETKNAKFVCIAIAFDNDHGDEDTSGGLASVYAIAQQHCGWLEVTRDPYNRTSFDLYLPVAKPDDGTTMIGDRAIEITGGHETILLVEDELDLLSLTRDILERYGYRIITAPNGMAALKVWRERRNEIDLLVTDVRMPEGISGHELADRLVSDKPSLKVVYVSGYSADTHGSHHLEILPNFVTKPFTPPGLALTVRKALDSQISAHAA
jgi:two-component system cell cycle sensor histidine kinase/response regulator CckA